MSSEIDRNRLLSLEKEFNISSVRNPRNIETIQLERARFFTEKGSLYMEKEMLYKHNGSYSLKFGDGCYNLAIAPSRKFAIFSYRDKDLAWSGKGELFQIDLTTKDVKHLVKKGFYIAPEISEDNKHLIYSDKKEIYLLDLDTKRKEKIGKGTQAKWL